MTKRTENVSLTDVALGLGLLAGTAVAIYLWRRGPAGVAGDVGGAVGKAAGGAVVGATKGVASGLGVPDTNSKSCVKALAERRLWDASFDCPAADFLRGLFGITPGDTAARVVTAAQDFDTDPYEWDYD